MSHVKILAPAPVDFTTSIIQRIPIGARMGFYEPPAAQLSKERLASLEERAASLVNSPGCVSTQKKAAVPGRKITSPYKGVTLHCRSNRWEAHIWHKSKQVHLGVFATEVQAAIAYDLVAIKLRGPKEPVLNFHVSHYEVEVEQLGKMSEEEALCSVKMWGRTCMAESTGGRKKLNFQRKLTAPNIDGAPVSRGPKKDAAKTSPESRKHARSPDDPSAPIKRARKNSPPAPQQPPPTGTTGTTTPVVMDPNPTTLSPFPAQSSPPSSGSPSVGTQVQAPQIPITTGITLSPQDTNIPPSAAVPIRQSPHHNMPRQAFKSAATSHPPPRAQFQMGPAHNGNMHQAGAPVHSFYRHQPSHTPAAATQMGSSSAFSGHPQQPQVGSPPPPLSLRRPTAGDPNHASHPTPQEVSQTPQQPGTPVAHCNETLSLPNHLLPRLKVPAPTCTFSPLKPHQPAPQPQDPITHHLLSIPAQQPHFADASAQLLNSFLNSPTSLSPLSPTDINWHDLLSPRHATANPAATAQHPINTYSTSGPINAPAGPPASIDHSLAQMQAASVPLVDTPPAMTQQPNSGSPSPHHQHHQHHNDLTPDFISAPVEASQQLPDRQSSSQLPQAAAELGQQHPQLSHSAAAHQLPAGNSPGRTPRPTSRPTSSPFSDLCDALSLKGYANRNNPNGNPNGNPNNFSNPSGTPQGPVNSGRPVDLIGAHVQAAAAARPHTSHPRQQPPRPSSEPSTVLHRHEHATQAAAYLQRSASATMYQPLAAAATAAPHPAAPHTNSTSPNVTASTSFPVGQSAPAAVPAGTQNVDGSHTATFPAASAETHPAAATHPAANSPNLPQSPPVQLPYTAQYPAQYPVQAASPLLGFQQPSVGFGQQATSQDGQQGCSVHTSPPIIPDPSVLPYIWEPSSDFSTDYSSGSGWSPGPYSDPLAMGGGSLSPMASPTGSDFWETLSATDLEAMVSTDLDLWPATWDVVEDDDSETLLSSPVAKKRRLNRAHEQEPVLTADSFSDQQQQQAATPDARQAATQCGGAPATVDPSQLSGLQQLAAALQKHPAQLFPSEQACEQPQMQAQQQRQQAPWSMLHEQSQSQGQGLFEDDEHAATMMSVILSPPMKTPRTGPLLQQEAVPYQTHSSTWQQPHPHSSQSLRTPHSHSSHSMNLTQLLMNNSAQSSLPPSSHTTNTPEGAGLHMQSPLQQPLSGITATTKVSDPASRKRARSPKAPAGAQGAPQGGSYETTATTGAGADKRRPLRGYRGMVPPVGQPEGGDMGVSFPQHHMLRQVIDNVLSDAAHLPGGDELKEVAQDLEELISCLPSTLSPEQKATLKTFTQRLEQKYWMAKSQAKSQQAQVVQPRQVC